MNSRTISLYLKILKLHMVTDLQGGESFFRNILSAMETVYLNRNPTAKKILELVHSAENDHICYDHFAFRTFGVKFSVSSFSFLINDMFLFVAFFVSKCVVWNYIYVYSLRDCF